MGSKRKLYKVILVWSGNDQQEISPKPKTMQAAYDMAIERLNRWPGAAAPKYALLYEDERDGFGYRLLDKLFPEGRS